MAASRAKARTTRLCIDEASRLLTSIEVSDDRGVRERLRFELLDGDVADASFDVDTI